MKSEKIEKEKNKYNKIYTDLVFACDDLKQILDEEELNKRSFIKKVDVLKEYMNFLDNIEKEENNNKGLFQKLFNSQKNPEEKIDAYLDRKKLVDLDKLDKCSKCECRNCVKVCNMNHCFNCREKEYVSGCNKENALLTNSDDTVSLYQGDKEFVFNVKGYLIEKDNEGRYSRYVYLVDKDDYDNQHILRYSKLKGEEYYDSVIEGDNQDELIRVNDKFIEMGLRV
ncbi:hypothetical protein CHF27_007895 [Romboutsia maritimum]|uniref:DUF1292 domain-containing protein n=1 Tax=Romboutsia maritimum TaxID=2020948 RepID=A0A371ISS2_9FIRM|nr:hypothetical protein [Romboutsia maritimum]RDY23536.1 hypothetical protein CHF27_007895 [Romboutsia maritimum]